MDNNPNSQGIQPQDGRELVDQENIFRNSRDLWPGTSLSITQPY